MNSKKFLAACVAAIAIAVCFSPQLARATSLSYNNGAVQAIDDFTIAGTYYNITWVSAPADPSNISSLAPPSELTNDDLDRIYDVLNESGNQTVYNSSMTVNGGGTNFFYLYGWIPTNATYAEVFDITSSSTPTAVQGQLSPDGQWHGYTYFPFDLSPTNSDYGSYAFAKFTPETSPVPEPTTVLLLGLGLIFLAGLLRKSKRHINIA